MTALLLLFCIALFLNGATDAANSVTGAVSSRALPSAAAMLIAALCEGTGLILSYLFLPSVAKTVASLADFGMTDDAPLVCSVCLAAVGVWSATAWALGLPTSESHGLMAAMCGCSAALGTGIDMRAACAVAVGLALSVLGGSAAAALAARLMSSLDGRKIEKKLCIMFLCASAFLHGAQDGQKFLALLFSAGVFENKTAPVLICAALMGFGTLCGGGRIVKKMGRQMTSTDLHAACLADAGSSAALLLLTAAGLPVSTTHVKMSALAAVAGHRGTLDKKTFVSLAAAWLTTFPFCYFVAFLLIKLIFSSAFC